MKLELSRRQDIATMKRSLQMLEKAPAVQSTMRALKNERRKRYGAVCVLVSRGLVLTEKGFRLRNLVNFEPSTPLKPPHPSVDRISISALGKRPGLVAAFAAENYRYAARLTPQCVRDKTRLTYVGMDEWPCWQRCLFYATMAATCGAALVPEILMWPLYKRLGALGGAQASEVDAMLKERGMTPTGQSPALGLVPSEIGTQANVQSEWGALGELTEQQRLVLSRKCRSIHDAAASARRAWM